MTIFDIIIIALELIGLSISIYLIAKNYKELPPVCMIGHDCGAVLNSKYSRFLGLKMETYGFLYYISMLVLFSAKFYLTEYISQITITFGILSTIGMAVSVILTYIQIRVIKSLCTWCLFAAFTNLLLFTVIVLYFSTN